MEVVELDTDFAQLRRELERIDWGFGTKTKPHPVDSLHPYPAKFIRAIPETLIATLPIPEGTRVFDPFCGSGTTLTAAQRAGIASIGIDLNPIGCLISTVRTSALRGDLSSLGDEVIRVAKTKRTRTRVDIPNVDHWFQRDVQEAVAALVSSIASVKPIAARNALRLALSSILVRVSNQESDTRYAAIEKNVSRQVVFEQFTRAVGFVERALQARTWDLPRASVLEGDVLTAKAEKIGRDIGLVVTSPPYPNAYEYWLYHKYRMWWLGFDALSVKAREIGARAHFFKGNHHTEENFWEQMRKTTGLIDQVLVRDGFACFVIGRSKIHGRYVDNSAIIRQIGAEQGWTLVANIERVISSNRKSFNLAHAKIKTETLIVFAKT